MSRKSKENKPRENHDPRRKENTISDAADRAALWKINEPGDKNSYMASAICVFLLLSVVLVYGQTIRHEFINYDDDVYVYDNSALKDGVTWKAVAWSFTSFEGFNWHPVTWLSHMLDRQMFDLRPGGHHAVNVAFHIINSILLYILLLRMTAAEWRSAMVAVLFALHPLHVESVAWVAERKDMLSTMFALLTILAYLGYVSRPSVIRYVLVFVLLALGLMSKPMLVTLPFVLLLLDYWPLGRWKHSPPGCLQFRAENSSGRRALWLVMEKLPLMVLAAASSAVTCIAQQEVMETKLELPILLANALVSYVSYLGKTVWPYPLIVFYPYEINLPWWQPASAAIVLIVVTVLAIWLWRRRPYFLVGWLWYMGTLVPVIGFVQVGGQSMADRYTYIPLIGIFILIVWGVTDLAAPWRYRRTLLGTLAAAVTLACMVLTFRQLTHWTDSQTLFEYVLSISPDNLSAHNNLGNVLLQIGRPAEAIEHYEQALRLKSDCAEAHNNLATVLFQVGRLREAVEHYEQALRLKPNDSMTHYNLANTLIQAGRPEEVIEHYQQALRFKPDFADAHNNLAIALVKTGRLREAIDHYRQALQLNPEYAHVHNNLGEALCEIGQPQEAIEHCEQALRLKPNYPEAEFNLGIALGQTGRLTESIAHFMQALELKPDYSEVYVKLALTYAGMHQSSQAMAAARKALELARAEGQTALAKQIEDWMNSYRAGLSENPSTQP